MHFNKQEREEMRKLQNQGMISAVGEYTPEEFWKLLDDIDELEDIVASYDQQEDRFIEIIDTLETEVRMLKVGEPSTGLKELRKLIKWKEALQDVLICAWIEWDEENPRTALHELLTRTAMEALDPCISKGAVDLIEKYGGKYEDNLADLPGMWDRSDLEGPDTCR